MNSFLLEGFTKSSDTSTVVKRNPQVRHSLILQISLEVESFLAAIPEVSAALEFRVVFTLVFGWLHKFGPLP